MEFGSLRRGGVEVGGVSPPKSPGAGDDTLGEAGGGIGGCRSMAALMEGVCVCVRWPGIRQRRVARVIRCGLCVLGVGERDTQTCGDAMRIAELLSTQARGQGKDMSFRSCERRTRREHSITGRRRLLGCPSCLRYSTCPQQVCVRMVIKHGTTCFGCFLTRTCTGYMQRARTA